MNQSSAKKNSQELKKNMLFKILKLNFRCFSFWPGDTNCNVWKTKLNLFLIFSSVTVHILSSIMAFRENTLPEALVSLGPATTQFLTAIKILYIFLNAEKFKLLINKIMNLLENSIHHEQNNCIKFLIYINFVFFL